MSANPKIAVADKTQWNTRIRPEFRRGIKIVSAMTDLSQDDLAELGIALLFGADTAALTRCRALVLAAAKRSGHKLPLEHFQQLA